MSEGFGGWGYAYDPDYAEERGLGANKAVFDPIEARFGRPPTLDEILRANDAVSFNLRDDHSPMWGPAQGYACALTAIMADAIAMEKAKPTRREAGSARKGDSAGPQDIAQKDIP